MTEKNKRKTFSSIGWYLNVIIIVSSAAQILTGFIVESISTKLMSNIWVSFTVMFGSMYLIGVPVANIVLKKKIIITKEKRKMSLKQWIKYIPVTVFFTYVGSIAGEILTSVITAITGILPADPVESLLSGSDIVVSIVFAGIIGPVVEEYIFRKQIINHTRMFGEKRSVLFSAFVFALFHGNLSQMFYAFTLGLVFGYVYIKTDDIKYSAGLHMFVNLISGVFAGELLNGIDLNVIDSGLGNIVNNPDFVKYIVFVIYTVIMIGLAIAGAVIFFENRKNIKFNAPYIEIEKPLRTIYFNTGMVLFIINMIISIAGTFTEI